MQREFIVLLRAISNLPMSPFCSALQELGFTDVKSFGMSGNLMFNAAGKPLALERLISARLGTMAIVRRRADLARIVSRNPYRERSGATVFLLTGAPAPALKRRFDALEFAFDRPVLIGRTIYFVHPAQLKGRRAVMDFERELGTKGTARTARVVDRLLELMG